MKMKMKMQMKLKCKENANEDEEYEDSEDQDIELEEATSIDRGEINDILKMRPIQMSMKMTEIIKKAKRTQELKS